MGRSMPGPTPPKVSFTLQKRHRLRKENAEQKLAGSEVSPLLHTEFLGEEYAGRPLLKDFCKPLVHRIWGSLKLNGTHGNAHTLACRFAKSPFVFWKLTQTCNGYLHVRLVTDKGVISHLVLWLFFYCLTLVLYWVAYRNGLTVLKPFRPGSTF